MRRLPGVARGWIVLALVCFACDDAAVRVADPAATVSVTTSSATGAASGASGGVAGAPPNGQDSTGTGASGGSGESGGTPSTAGGGGEAGSDAAVGAAGSEGLSLAFVTEPVLVGNPQPSVPQAAVLRLETNVAVEVDVTVTGGGEQWSLELPEGTEFEVPIVGVKPDTAYSVALRASTGEDALNAGPLAWTSPALPADFPLIQAARSEPLEMEPGMTLFNVNVGQGANLMVVADHAGVVRWYYSDVNHPVREEAQRLANGHFLFVRDFCSVLEVDVLGNPAAGWHAAEHPRSCSPWTDSVAVPIQSLHHEVHQLPDGNFLALATETRTVENFPTSEDDANAARQTALVVGGVIVEFTPEGQLLKYIPLMDLLDPTRIGRNSLATSWSSKYAPEGELAYDWDHANAVVYEAASDAYYVSLRNQDAIVKVSRAKEELIWILGTPANWISPWVDKLLAPTGELEWPFHQHAVELTPLGLDLYDNGNHRAAAFEPVLDEYSRAVIYQIDEVALTVAQAWSYGEPSGSDSFFSRSRGDADWQPITGNVLMVNGSCRNAADIAYAQILEITPDGRRVFELNVGDPSDVPVDTRSQSIYRAQRLADLRQ